MIHFSVYFRNVIIVRVKFMIEVLIRINKMIDSLLVVVG